MNPYPDDYTPTTEEVRAGYHNWVDERTSQDGGAEFDRWLRSYRWQVVQETLERVNRVLGS